MKEPFADFRSDTFTLPDDAMRRVIYEAEVGNSAYGEDPSVTELELFLAEFFEREAALFFPSATMAGQAAIAVWCNPAEIVLIEEYGHNFYFETGSMSLISGTQARTVLENSSNYGGGTVYPPATLDAIYSLADSHGLPVHIDGARIFNALEYYRQTDVNISPAQLLPARGSISVCFSKGLGAPMGAALVGDAQFIAEAARMRSLLGGTMRQVGFMAAAALYGLRHNRDRIVEDHANARYLAQGLAKIEGLSVALETVQTNMVYVDVVAGAARADRLITQLADKGIMAWSLSGRLRFVTSMLVGRDNCDHAVAVAGEALAE